MWNLLSSISEVQAVYGSVDANSVLNEYQKKNNLPIENKKLLSIRIESNFHYNCNTAYFDNIQVCDDDYGVVYNHNDKGSVTEITGSIGNKTTFTRDSASDEVTNIKDKKTMKLILVIELLQNSIRWKLQQFRQPAEELKLTLYMIHSEML